MSIMERSDFSSGNPDLENPDEDESYFNFINSIRSEVTKANYLFNLNLYMRFCKLAKMSDLLTISDPQKQIIKNTMSLRERKMATGSISTMVNAIYHFATNYFFNTLFYIIKSTFRILFSHDKLTTTSYLTLGVNFRKITIFGNPTKSYRIKHYR